MRVVMSELPQSSFPSPSHNTVIHPILFLFHNANIEQIQKAFSSKLQLRRRIYIVVAKGVRKSSLHNYKELKKVIQVNKIEVLQLKAVHTQRKDAIRVNLIVRLPSLKEGNRLCKEGLVINAEVFRAEPYNKNVQLRQYYRCYQFGYIEKFYIAAI